MVDGSLRAVAVPEEEAEASGRRFALRAVQGRTQGAGTDDAVGEVPVHGLAGEVVPGRVLGIPPDAGHDVVDEDEAGLHRLVPHSAWETSRSITSDSGRPAAAIILG